LSLGFAGILDPPLLRAMAHKADDDD